MRAAALADVMVPKLCASDSLEAFGSCRLCLVQIEGRNGFPASCTTPVEPGMKVRTQNEKLARLRRGVMELYMSDHPLDPFECKAGGNANCMRWREWSDLNRCAIITRRNHLALRSTIRILTSRFDPVAMHPLLAMCPRVR